jgi:hypothetical protein
MGKLRAIAVPAAFLLAIMGSTGTPGPDRGSSPSRSLPRQRAAGVLQPVIHPAGDFNGDGFADLAVGVPFEDVGGAPDAGAVNVLYGSSGGLAAAGNQFWTQDSPGIGDAVEPNDQFGFAMAPGDFNHDGFADLAIGVPLEDGPEDSGAVNVIYGSATGLGPSGNQVWTQDSPGIRNVRERGDQFGRAVATGDFNHDDFDDLAVGVPFENVNGHSRAGAVNVLYGSTGGLVATGNQFWSQDSAGVVNASERGDTLGFSLAASDFNGDSFADLAVGVPGEGGPPGAGAVSVILGSSGGLRAAGNRLWSQNSRGVKDGSEAVDQFGYSLAGGDFNHDGFADLAVGVPFEDISKKANAGAVNVLYGSASGLRAFRNQFWTQDSPGIRNATERGDEFGFSLAASDFNDDGLADLAIGIPGEDPPSNGGSVAVVFGHSPALSSASSELWSQNSLGGGPSEVADLFGFSLTAGAFGNGPAGDLAIGVAGEDVPGNVDAGAVNVGYGSPGGLRPEGSQYWTQDQLIGPAEAGDRFGYGIGV